MLEWIYYYSRWSDETFGIARFYLQMNTANADELLRKEATVD